MRKSFHVSGKRRGTCHGCCGPSAVNRPRRDFVQSMVIRFDFCWKKPARRREYRRSYGTVPREALVRLPQTPRKMLGEGIFRSAPGMISGPIRRMACAGGKGVSPCERIHPLPRFFWSAPSWLTGATHRLIPAPRLTGAAFWLWLFDCAAIRAAVLMFIFHVPEKTQPSINLDSLRSG